jgi:hypothetical protein
LQAPSAPPGGWHHIAYTYDPAVGHALYLDGAQLVGSTQLPKAGSIATVTMGTFAVPWEMYAGLLDDVRIYDRPLNSDEVRALARGF